MNKCEFCNENKADANGVYCQDCWRHRHYINLGGLATIKKCIEFTLVNLISTTVETPESKIIKSKCATKERIRLRGRMVELLGDSE